MSEPRCACNCHDPLWRKGTRKHEHRTHLYCQKYLLREAAGMEEIADKQIAALRAENERLRSLLAHVASLRVLCPRDQERVEEAIK